MPESTPIYGFPYPCPGDTIDATDFADLANAVDAQMLIVQGAMDYALGRYNVQQPVSSQAGLLPGVETILASAGSTYVIPADGFYLAAFRLTLLAVAGVHASHRIRLRLATVAIPGYTQAIGNLGASSQLTGVPIFATAGQTVDIGVTYFGTGTGTVNGMQLDVRQVVRVA